MLFKLLTPLWILIRPLISHGPAADAQLAQMDASFARDLTIFLLMVRVVLGYEVLIVSGLRTAAQQAAQHAADPRNPAPNLAKPDVHMRGVAADLCFYKNGKLVLGKKGFTAAQWAAVYALADLCDISNGHAFKGYADINHFFRS